MPRKSSPNDDPFADLFGKLPDPRDRGGAAPGPMRTPASSAASDDTDDEYVYRPRTASRLPLLEVPGAPSFPQASPAAPSSIIVSTGPLTLPGAAATTGPAPAAPRGPAASDAPSAAVPGATGPTGANPPSGGTPTQDPSPATGGAPLSRRAAREALRAGGAATGSTPTSAAIPAAATTPTSAESPASAAASAAPGSPPSSEADYSSASTPTAPAAVTSFDDLLAPSAATTPGRDARGPQPRAAAPTASIEDLFAGRSSSDDIGEPPPPRDKRKRRMGGWIALAIVLILFGGIAAGGLWVWNTYEDKIREFMGWEEPKDYEEGMATGEALVTISAGDTGSVISQSLFDAGVTKTPEAFYDHLVATGQNPTFYPGVYKLQQKMTSEAALAALQDPTSKMENSALVREGLTVDQTLQVLAEGVGIPLEDFQAAIADPAAFGVTVDPAITAAGGQPLEGWLFPAMYTFDPGVTAADVIQTMVDRTVKSLDSAGVPAEDRQKILTIASIIQREARFQDDFYKVSRVIQNRMDPSNDQTFGLLQMDSTAQYGYGEMHDGTVSSTQEALDDPNPWNTYVHQGLPVGPIANPGDVAIDAAMHPADGPWLYFVTVNPDTGETVFTNTVGEHEKYVAQWQEWCAANPGKC